MSANRRILVVDDDPLVLASCRRILGEADYAVCCAKNGLQGMKRAMAERFDLLITDLKMPDLDGMDIVKSVKENRPGTPIIIITAYGTIPSAIEATKLGVSEYVQKPFSPDQLLAAVRKVLGPPDDVSRGKNDAKTVRKVLRRASRDHRFGARLLAQGSLALSEYTLPQDAKAAITAGDIRWIEQQCGDLSSDERKWLEGRLEAEIW